MAKGSAGAFKLFGWLIFDAVVTLGIITTLFLAFFVLSPLLLHENLDATLVEVMAGALLSLFEVESVDDFPILGIFLYSTFFTSVWVWLYAFAGIAVRLVYRARGTQAFLDTHMNVATRPLSVMCGVLIVLFTIAYWPAMAIAG
ncbi:MAG: hypothetical protein OEU36_02690 [Gammaproteobacteria bacterium]|nr:hypothetical protein [Gammaproteobacteria bacterium]